MPGLGPATEYIIIDDYLIDCSIRETHNYDSDITEYPVESGSNVVDNIRPLPITVEIEGLVSNTPIGRIKSERQVGIKPTDHMYGLFMIIRNDREPVTIRTALATYENMAMKSLTIPKGDHEDALRFTATFIQVKSVENKRVVRVSVPIAGKGKKVAKSPEEYKGRALLIDKVNKAWFDPDLPGWRNYATYGRATITKDSGDARITTYTERNYWHLYRGLPLAQQKTNLLYTPTGGIHKVETPKTYWDVDLEAKNFLYSIITVPIEQCILHNFTIATPAGPTRGYYQGTAPVRSDAAR